MRQAFVKYKNEQAGTITQHDDASFTFEYFDTWVSDISKNSISLTLPKEAKLFQSTFLFPFFYNMLPEGSNKLVVCKYNKIDSDDYFSLLLLTAQYDTIGAVTISKIDTA